MPRKLRTFSCKYCGSSYEAKAAYTKKRCDTCRPIGAFWESGYGRWLLQLIQRHEYQEAFQNFCIWKMHEVYQQAVRCRGYYKLNGKLGCRNELDICHLYPTNGEYISPCNHLNLVVANRSVNRSLQDKDFGFNSTGVLKRDGTRTPEGEAARRRWFETMAKVAEFQAVKHLRAAVQNDKDFVREVDDGMLWEQCHHDGRKALRMPIVVVNRRLVEVGVDEAHREILMKNMPIDYEAAWSYLVTEGHSAHKHEDAMDYGLALDLFWRKKHAVSQ